MRPSTGERSGPSAIPNRAPARQSDEDPRSLLAAGLDAMRTFAEARLRAESAMWHSLPLATVLVAANWLVYLFQQFPPDSFVLLFAIFLTAQVAAQWIRYPSIRAKIAASRATLQRIGGAEEALRAEVTRISPEGGPLETLLDFVVKLPTSRQWPTSTGVRGSFQYESMRWFPPAMLIWAGLIILSDQHANGAPIGTLALIAIATAAAAGSWLGIFRRWERKQERTATAFRTALENRVARLLAGAEEILEGS